MNVFTKLKQLLSKLFNRSQPEFSSSEFLAQQKKSLKNLQNTLTELIFQRKKYEARIKALETEKFQLQLDLEAAAEQDRDDLAVRLMDQQDEVLRSLQDAVAQHETLCHEIEEAKEMEKELQRQIEKSQSQVAVLMSRMESAKMRERLQGEFSRLQSEVRTMQPGFNDIEANILKLEAKLETMHGAEPKFFGEMRKLRQQRTRHLRQAELVSLKEKLRGGKLLTEGGYVNVLPESH